MTQTIDAHKSTIGALLGRYERRPVVLPPFQRSYSWEKAQINTFWDDLLSFIQPYNAAPLTASYFMGSIVVIESPEQVVLLDGQQRMATSIIALAAIRDLARDIDKRQKPEGQKGRDFARDIQRELLEKDTEPVSYSLTLSELDEPFFLKAVKQDPPAVPDTKLRSHLLIRSAYLISRERMESATKGTTYDDTLRLFKSIHDVLSKGVALVSIVVQNEEDAYSIFETLNDRGLRLSVPDLVLNLLMRRAPDATSRQIVRQNWNQMLRQMARRDISRFLRHMWVSMYGDVKNEGLYSAIKNSLETNTATSVEFAEQCGDECEWYTSLIDLDVPLQKEAHSNLEGIVKYLGISFAPPLLLSGIRCLEETDFARLLSAITTTFVRYVVIANRNPVDLETAFYEAAREIRTLSRAGESSGKQFHAAKTILKRFVVDDVVIESSAEQVSLERSEAIWLLTRLANKMQSKTKELALDQVNLEHIFPQKAGTAWPNRSDLEPLIWHLGNLTILGDKLNRQAQNKNFTDKSTQYYSKSEIVMTRELLGNSVWTEQTIVARAKQLGKLTSEVWPQLS